MNSRRKSPKHEHENSIKFLLIEVFFYIAVEGPLRVCDEQNELGKNKIKIGKHFYNCVYHGYLWDEQKILHRSTFLLTSNDYVLQSCYWQRDV